MSLSFQEQLNKILSPYQKRIEAKIAQTVEELGPASLLRDACDYALKAGGKRFRPALVYIVADALSSSEKADDVALAVEYFHTASLIADDLPCMDDETFRRGKQTTHLAFGEATALLATYGLIAAGYERLGRGISGERLSIALENATFNTGLNGATGGQFMDLYPPQLDQEILADIIQKKTGALFELSFVLGWLVGMGDISQLSLVKKAAGHFGKAFQIVDDFEDLEKDVAEGRLINYPALLGKKKAFELLNNELEGLDQTLQTLGLTSPEILGMSSFLKAAASYTSASSAAVSSAS